MTGCTSSNDISIDGQTEQQQVATDNSQLQQSQNLEAIKTITERYNNPKRATLRDSDFNVFGKVYMQYDKAEDKTYFWAKLTNYPKPEDNTQYSVWLIDNKATDTSKQQLNLGNLFFTEDGHAQLYYEFDDFGNKYNYLKVVITKNGDVPDTEHAVLRAYFNPKLS